MFYFFDVLMTNKGKCFLSLFWVKKHFQHSMMAIRREAENRLWTNMQTFFVSKHIKHPLVVAASKLALYLSMSNKYFIHSVCQRLSFLSQRQKDGLVRGCLIVTDKLYASYPQLAFSALTWYDVYLKRDMKMRQRLLDWSSFVAWVLTYILIVIGLWYYASGVYVVSWLMYAVSRTELVSRYIKDMMKEKKK